MRTFDHLVTVDIENRLLIIYRIDSAGEKELYTSIELPDIKDDKEFSEFSRVFGENILLDSPNIRKIYGF